MKKYTYKDWFDGDVTLKYAKSIFIDGSIPLLVSWDEFDEIDVKKIKDKQEELFNKIVETNLNNFKNHFCKKYKKSMIKDELVENERQEFANILNAPIPDTPEIVSKYLKILFKRDDLLEIQSYFKNTILGGRFDNYDFVQSPNDKHQYNLKTPSEAIAMVYYKYLEWLIEHFDNNILESDESVQFKASNKREKENSFPRYFYDRPSYDFFIELKDMLVNKETRYADYSFIFHKMIKGGYINDDTKQMKFIEFLNREYDADISYRKLPFKNQKKHNNIYYKLERKYKK